MKKLVAAALVLASSAAFAAEGTQSEYFYQATAGTHQGTAGLELADGKVNGGGGDVDVTAQALFAEYEYGINDMLSIGGRLTYTQSKVDTSPSVKATGLNDLEIALRGKHVLGTGLRYGANLNLAIADGETKSDGDSNQATGGIVLAPYVGYEMYHDKCAFGGRISRDLRLKDDKSEDKTTSPSTTTETSGGEATTLAGFYEHNFNEKYTLGGSLTYAMTDDSKPDGAADVDEGTTTTIDVYSQIRAVGPGMLVPHIAYEKTSADTDVKGTTIGVKYRMNF